MKTKILANFQICISVPLKMHVWPGLFIKMKPIAGVSLNLSNCFRTVFLQNTFELPLCFMEKHNDSFLRFQLFPVSSIYINQKMSPCLLARLRAV